jgi:sensor c-di-GMP phosphodiesterase-like protein
VAEGIETLEQVIYIQEEGCDYAQGFYYFKPLALHDFIELIKVN